MRTSLDTIIISSKNAIGTVVFLSLVGLLLIVLAIINIGHFDLGFRLLSSFMGVLILLAAFDYTIKISCMIEKDRISFYKKDKLEAQFLFGDIISAIPYSGMSALRTGLRSLYIKDNKLQNYSLPLYRFSDPDRSLLLRIVADRVNSEADIKVLKEWLKRN